MTRDDEVPIYRDGRLLGWDLYEKGYLVGFMPHGDERGSPHEQRTIVRMTDVNTRLRYKHG